MLPSTINIFEKAAKKAGRILARDFGEIENLQIKSTRWHLFGPCGGACKPN